LQQRAIQQRFRDFQNLPESRRQQLREQFQRRPPGGFTPRPQGTLPGDNLKGSPGQPSQ
jgi:hypothetical protein